MAGARAAVILLWAACAVQGANTTLQIEPFSDTYIKAGEPDRNFGTADRLEIGEHGSESALLRFDLSRVPLTAYIRSATLTLTFYGPYNAAETTIRASDLARDFVETQATYKQAANGQPWRAPGLRRFEDYEIPPYSFVSKPIRTNGGGVINADLTSLVRGILDSHKRTVNLVLLIPGDGLGGTVFGRRAADAAKRPKLQVTYDAIAPRAIPNHPFIEDKFGAVTLSGEASAHPDGSKKGLQYLWTVDRPAPGSTYSPGQELGRTAQVRFEPDVPGQWLVRLRVTDSDSKEFTEETTSVTDLALQPHPRLGLDDRLLAQLRGLRTSKKLVWLRFQESLDSMEKNESYQTIEGSRGQALLLGYAITKERRYFTLAWRSYLDRIYANGSDRGMGLRPFLGACGKAVYCDEHAAAYQGGRLTADVAILYDWGFDALAPGQRQDLIDWINAAANYLYLENPYLHTHFRNDAAAIVTGLAAAAYGTYGENRRALAQMAWFRQEWAHTMEAFDVMGRGGAMAEGMGYGEATAGSYIFTANLIYYASGENLFYSHPFFQRHLAFEAFSVYPNRLRETDDPLTPTKPPAPFPEGAALGGDDDRGISWHIYQLRPNGLCLSRRFVGTEEAEIWNWVFRQADTEQNDDPWVDILYYSPPPALSKPKRLSFFDPSLGYVFVRSDWNGRDATWISSWAGPHLDLHQHLDQGSFTLFKRRDLAIKSGNYESNPAAPHDLMYYTRTVSSNSLLVGDPKEFFSGFIRNYGCDGRSRHDVFPIPPSGPDVCIANDGGQRTMAPYPLAIFDNDDYFAHRDVYDTAKVISFRDNGKAVSWVEDITNAYSNPRHTAPLEKPKVINVYRRFVYLREPDLLLIADTVESAEPTFEKSWLLHAVDQLNVSGTVKEIDPGESIHTNTDRALLVVDDKKPANLNQVTSDLRRGYAALQVKTLFPANFQYRIIGGREASQTAHAGDREGTHFHRHLKDFWVKDYSEGVQADHRSANWPPAAAQETITPLMLPVFSGGYGRWRLEIQPTVPARTDYFLNALKPTLREGDSMPNLTKFENSTTFGVSFTSGGQSYKVTFSKDRLDAPLIDGMDMEPPVISGMKPESIVPAGTKEVPVSLKTNEAAYCRYSVRGGVTFPYMTGAFQTTDGLNHSLAAKHLAGGDTYTYFVRCQDKFGNENLEDVRLTFSVAQ